MASRLDLLFVSHFPVSPASFGAQRRIDGLMRALARDHRLSFVGLASEDFDIAAAEVAMRAYCHDVVLVPWPEGSGRPRRTAQVRSLVSRHSFERRTMNPVALQRAIDDVLARRRFDLVSLETPFIAPRLVGPDGSKPRVLIDAHNVEFDLARQYAERSPGVARRMFHTLNWPRLRAEEIAAWKRADAVAFTSPDDQARGNALVPGLRSEVVPNGVDTDQFRPPAAERARGTPPTVVFFGTMNYLPNIDAVRWLLQEIWPAVAQRVPSARLKIIGSHPPADVRSAHGPRIEVTGMVDDVRPHLEDAAAIVVPLRMGGGTRLKILESLAMGKAVVSTRLGAEGIAAEPGEHLLLADDPAGLADALVRVLEEPGLAARLGQEGRELIAGTYSWSAIARRLESLIHEVVRPPEAATARTG